MAMYPCLQGGGGGTTDALYEECKSHVMSGTPTSLSVYGNRVDDVTGGYVRNGRTFWLYVKCRATSTIDANGIYRNANAPGGWTILTGAPSIYGDGVMVGGSIESTYCTISSSGSITYVMNPDSPGTTSSGKVYVVPVGEYFEIWAKGGTSS